MVYEKLSYVLWGIAGVLLLIGGYALITGEGLLKALYVIGAFGLTIVGGIIVVLIAVYLYSGIYHDR